MQICFQYAQEPLYLNFNEVQQGICDRNNIFFWTHKYEVYVTNSMYRIVKLEHEKPILMSYSEIKLK